MAIASTTARWLPAGICLASLIAAGWLGRAADGPQAAVGWTETAPGILRTQQDPAGYALIAGNRALLIDVPYDPAGLRARGIEHIDGVLLTHHHRDACDAAAVLREQRVPVRAAKAAAEWLEPERVRKFWRDNVPLRHSRTAAYLVVADGIAGIDCSLIDGQKIEWKGWNIEVVATPGHSKDHLVFLARRGSDGKKVALCGDLLAAPGKLWTPYTTDWDHWTDLGLKPTAASLRKLAALKPEALLPAHGAPILTNGVTALEQTADRVAEIAFLRSFERFTKQRLGNAPAYRFLAREQAESNGSKPWSQISEHLFLTGNTYVLASRDERAFLVLDPWDERSAKQVARLKKDRNLGKLEVVLFSHAHNDHYDGVYHLPNRESFQVWTLDRVAAPIADPYRFRAPFLDARPVRFDRLLRDGETVQWHEYQFRFHHLPGQSYFTMGIETTLPEPQSANGRRLCIFTADNWFHCDQFSGSGGWMGMNRSFPLAYAQSAQKVLDLKPDWVLAEHGGPFEFHAEDFRRRVEWAKVSAIAADAVCPSGNHLRDWNPHRIRVEPLLQKAMPGSQTTWTLEAHNPLSSPEKTTVALDGRGILPEPTWQLDLKPGDTLRRQFTLTIPANIGRGRHVFPLRTGDPSDAVLIVEVD